ncbi:MAG: hypothetical protein JWP01_2129 [Myxococcales bacterium]|nr:hypothetical protein [Myxococcales bacterium]
MSKVKVSVTLSKDLVRIIDRDARRTGSSRSGVIEEWLYATASRAAEQTIDQATTAYYATLRGESLDEDNAIALGMARAARAVTYDPPRRRPARRPR